LYQIGTVAQIVRYITTADGAHHMVCQGEQRFRIIEFLPDLPFLAARVERLPIDEEKSPEVEARLLQLRERSTQALQLLPQTSQELVQAVQGFTSAGGLADLVAGFLDIEAAEKQSILETLDLPTRVDRVPQLPNQR